jgi:hypothetical protein
MGCLATPAKEVAVAAAARLLAAVAAAADAADAAALPDSLATEVAQASPSLPSMQSLGWMREP